MIDRRLFIGALACGTIASPKLVRAQKPSKVWRMGYLREGTYPMDPQFWIFMREFGWIEGQNVVLVPRYATMAEELPMLAAELAELKVDLILANGNPAALAAKQATKSIPVLFGVALDPVERGLVASLARPGGNVTGFTYGYYAPKMLEILKLTLPSIGRVALPARYLDASLVEAAKTLGVKVSNTGLRRPEDIGPFYLAARNTGIDAVLIPADMPAWFGIHWALTAAEAAKNRIPSIANIRPFVEEGGLMSYGPILQHYRTLVPMIDKIFKGVKPGDIPVQLATKFELVINLKTAKSLGITIPQSILLRADEVFR